MKKTLTLCTLLLLLPLTSQAGIWPFNSKCEDLKQKFGKGELSIIELQEYTAECTKEKAEEAGESISDTASHIANNIGDKASETWDNLKETVKESFE